MLPANRFSSIFFLCANMRNGNEGKKTIGQEMGRIGNAKGRRMKNEGEKNKKNCPIFLKATRSDTTTIKMAKASIIKKVLKNGARKQKKNGERNVKKSNNKNGDNNKLLACLWLLFFLLWVDKEMEERKKRRKKRMWERLYYVKWLVLVILFNSVNKTKKILLNKAFFPSNES